MLTTTYIVTKNTITDNKNRTNELNNTYKLIKSDDSRRDCGSTFFPINTPIHTFYLYKKHITIFYRKRLHIALS